MAGDRRQRRREAKEQRRREKRARKSHKRGERDVRQVHGHEHAGPSVSIESPSSIPSPMLGPPPRPVPPSRRPIVRPDPLPLPSRRPLVGPESVPPPSPSRRVVIRPETGRRPPRRRSVVRPEFVLPRVRRPARPLRQPPGTLTGSAGSVAPKYRRRLRRKGSAIPAVLILLAAGAIVFFGLPILLQQVPTPTPRPQDAQTFTSVYGPAEIRTSAIRWRIEDGRWFSLHLPAGWEFQSEEDPEQFTMASSPNLAAFLQEQSQDRPHIATTGVLFRGVFVGYASSQNRYRFGELLRRLLKSETIDNCREHEPTVIFPEDNLFGFAGLMRFYSCDNGYQIIDTIAIRRVSTARAAIVRVVGTRAEMQYLIHIPDSVQRLSGP
jgi:hypothetical protein